MADPVARLNVALEGRYAIERELVNAGWHEGCVPSMIRA